MFFSAYSEIYPMPVVQSLYFGTNYNKETKKA
jgi:hypothetical protein